MSDCNNKVRNGFSDQKISKRCIIHNWAKGGHLVGSPKNGGPLGASLFAPSKNQNSMASNRRNNAKFTIAESRYKI